MCCLLEIDFALRIHSRLQGIVVHIVNYFLLKHRDKQHEDRPSWGQRGWGWGGEEKNGFHLQLTLHCHKGPKYITLE